MNNLEKVACPRCKGQGHIKGQSTKTGKLPNYKFNENGLCFACKGAKILHIDNKGRLLRKETNGNILEYDNKGNFKGIVKDPIPELETEFERDVKSRELKIRLELIRVFKYEDTRLESITKLNELILERNRYCELVEEKYSTEEIKVFLEIVLDNLNINKKLIDELKIKYKSISDLIKINEIYNNFQIEYFKLKLKYNSTVQIKP